MSNQAEMCYRKTAVGGASSVGLTISLYDTLAGDLRRAAAAVRGGDIPKRCREIQHAQVVLGYLETWIDPANGEELAKSLTIFYSYLRAKMMEGQLRQSAGILEELMRLVLDVRGSWQHLDSPAPTTSRGGEERPLSPAAVLSFPVSASPDERVVTSWSA